MQSTRGYTFGSKFRDEGGYGFTRGRGNNKVRFYVSTAEIQAWAKENAKDMTNTCKLSNVTAANTLRGQLRKAMKQGGGSFGIAEFSPYQQFTVDLKNKMRTPSFVIGGTLAEEKHITRWLENGVQWVGWPNARVDKHGNVKARKKSLSDLALVFQDGAGGAEAERMFTDNDQRCRLHKRGIADVPRAYVHVKRDVLTAFQAHIKANLESFCDHRLYEMIVKQLAIERGFAVKKGA